MRDLRRTSSAPDSVKDVVSYLASRRLWPLPDGCTLRAHAGAEYWSERKCIGRYPALLADVVDVDDELVTLHTTYLHAGAKLVDHPAKKLLSPMVGRRGCAVRLLPLDGDTLGVAEGLESALAAIVLHGVPVWSALNTSLLAKWIPPPGVKRVVIYSNRDVPGLQAAWQLRDALSGKCDVELKLPPAPLGDFADCLMVERRR